MDCYQVQRADGPIDIVVEVPGSKSMTNRALLMAAMTEGTTVLTGVQFSEDSRYFLQALQALGVALSVDESACRVTVSGTGGVLPRQNAEIYVGSAGTAARFLTAFTAFGEGVCRLDSSAQMKGRPMRELLVALEELGAEFRWLGEEYTFPFEVTGAGKKIGKKRISLNIDRSSQFLSALLMTAPMAVDELTICMTGTRSARSYVEMTEQMMKMFGHFGVSRLGDSYQVVRGNYNCGNYQIEPDVSAACYFYAAAAVTGGRAVVRHMRRNSLQGDMRFLEVLREMGCSTEWQEGELVVQGPAGGNLKGIDVCMADFSDQALTLAAIAPFADAPTTIRGVSHIRGQESDRLAVIVAELARIGIKANLLDGDDGVVIYPGTVRGAEIQTYNDHRVAMAFAVAGLRVDGIRIVNPQCCAKTFADYFTVFDKIRSKQRGI